MSERAGAAASGLSGPADEVGVSGTRGKTPRKAPRERANHEYVQVVTTVDSREAAEALARGAVEARLAACGQVSGPVHSTYRWQGAVETAQEWYVVFKTTAACYPALEAHLRERHSYDVPEIVALPIVAGNPAYLSWLDTGTVS